MKEVLHMECKEVMTGITVPIICALLGGGITLGGVWATIKNEAKKDREARRIAAKPLAFSYQIDYKELKSDNSKRLVYSMISKSGKGSLVVSGIIKNTDNGIMMLDRVESACSVYYPDQNRVVDKNTVIRLDIYLEDRVENLQDAYLYVKDIYGNQYKYAIDFTGNVVNISKCEDVSIADFDRN